MGPLARNLRRLPIRDQFDVAERFATRQQEEQVVVARKTKKQRLAQRAVAAKEFALDVIAVEGSFSDAIPVNSDGDPEHEPGGSCWITLRVKVADLTIEHELARVSRERGEG